MATCTSSFKAPCKAPSTQPFTIKLITYYKFGRLGAQIELLRFASSRAELGDERTTRRQRLMQQLGTHNCSDRALRSLSRPADEEQEGDAVDAPGNMTRLQQQELLSTSTPHGSLFKRLQLPSEDEQTPVVLHYLDPSAMLSAMVAMVPSFWDLLKTLQSQFGNLLHIVLYQDGACAGQMLTVNPAKSCQLFYLSILELGINRHSQTDFWWTLVCFQTRIMK